MIRSLGRRAHALACMACLGIVLLVLVLVVRPIGAGAAEGELVAQPVFGAPAARFLGASPQEAPGEAWALAKSGTKIVRYSDAGGWETVPGPFGEGGQPIAGLEFAPGRLVGRTTPAGGIAVAAQTLAGAQTVIVRDPGGVPHAVPDPGELLHGEEEETLFSGEGPDGVLLTPVEEPGGGTGAFDVPAAQPPARQEAVLAFDGSGWAREPICVGFEPGPECTRPPGAFHVLAIDASGIENAWLLAKRAGPEEGIELFQREVGGGSDGQAVWRQRQLGTPGSLGSLFAQGALEFPQPSPEPPLSVEVAARGAGQPLTVTPAGVWLDASLTVGGEHTDATVYYDVAEGKVTASWCDVAVEELCRFELGAELSSGGGRSFAWPPDGEPDDPFGQREITGLGQGAVLDLEGTGFARLALAGGGAGGAEGAALGQSGEGWLGASPPVHLTRAPEAVRLVPWPVPFRRPLTAIAPQPGAPVAALGSEALAVGADGEVARYAPEQGWVPESLFTGSGARARPTLRAVAWPEPGRAYAVGDGAAMWVWQKATELWEPDPAEPPNLARANFTGVAFDPDDPSRGYAVGKQGLLLAYGRQWTQEPLPAGVNPEANFTSIAFAGGEAIATYKMPFGKNGNAVYEGGVLVDDGSGWRVDQGAEEALAGGVPERVSGLPDGGAAIASEEARGGGGSAVIERQAAGQPWQQAPGDPGGYPAALAAIREGGQVRAIVTVSPGQGAEDLGTDFEQVFAQPPAAGPPLLSSPYPLPGSGILVRQTATGWRDEEHGSYPLPQRVEGQGLYDLPRHPDPMLALLIDPEGGQGWAVGGETGTSVRFQGAAIQTAGVVRYGPAAAPPENATPAPLAAGAGMASFAIGGNAQCAGPCADLSGTGIGPDVWLRSAVARAAGVEGVRAFLYTGPSVANGREEGGSESDLAGEIGRLAFGREEAAYGRRLAAAAGSLPTFPAPAASDLDGEGSLAAFEGAFAGFGAPLGEGPAGAGIAPRSSLGPDKGYYSFDSAGSGGTVRVIVLDYSASTLGDGQSCWLAGQLADAGREGTPAIVAGDRDLAGQAPNAAQDAASVVPILVDGTPPPGCAPAGEPSGASAYFFDFPEQNRTYRLTSGGRSIPAFGSGTLGYLVPQRPQETDFVGASGFLVASVDVQARDKATNVAPVGVRLIPNIAALALDATDGTVLRRSHVGLFDALARRPLAGSECAGNFAPGDCEAVRPDPYVPIPAQCQGARCGSAVLPEYSFSSSNPDIADFVAVDPGSSNPRKVLLVEGRPVADSSSGLLCAFNKGTTTVTVSTGGLSYSEKVTVLGGTAQRPCGTTPLKKQSAPEPPVEAVPPPTGEPGFSPVPASLPPPPPPAVPVPAHSPPAPQPPPPAPPLAFAPFVAPTVTAAPIVPIVPPPPVPLAQPTPPSGTSPVTEREEEVAYDLVHHMSAQRLPVGPRSAVFASSTASDGGSRELFLLPALAGLAALAGASAAGGRHRRRPAPNLAHQATNARRSRR